MACLFFGQGDGMTTETTDLKHLYINAVFDLSDLLRNNEKNTAVIQAYESLINVIANDSRFRAKTYIEYNQPGAAHDD
jgi:hypothetical protein